MACSAWRDNYGGLGRLQDRFLLPVHPRVLALAMGCESPYVYGMRQPICTTYRTLDAQPGGVYA